MSAAMSRRQRRRNDPVADLRAHLEQLDGAELRELLLEVTAELEPASYARLVDAAARRVVASKGRGALRSPRDAKLGADVTALVQLMRHSGYADPSAIDDLLARLNAAWTRGEHDVFRAGVLEIAAGLEGGVELGQHELYTEVIATDLDEVGRRLLVSVYLSTPADERARAIGAALDSLDVLEVLLDRPIEAMERTALEPLEGLDQFARAWATHLRGLLAGPKPWRGTWAIERRLQEATFLSAGTKGLAELARASGRNEDYEAWVSELLATGDSKAAARAAREGAARMGTPYEAGDLWTLAARIEIGRGKSADADLLEALRADPSALRLRRWIASVKKRARSSAVRGLELARGDGAFRASLAALRGEWARVAAVLERAEPLGWSLREHAGYGAVDAITWALSRDGERRELSRSRFEVPGLGDPGAWLDEDLAREEGLAALAAPPLLELLDELAPAKSTAAEAKKLRAAVEHAALARIAAVAEHSRRSRYDDAARLVALAAALHADARDARATDVIVRAREIAGRKWTLAQAIDRACRN